MAENNTTLGIVFGNLAALHEYVISSAFLFVLFIIKE